ncbi:MAG TPA: glycosyltransferase family 39 protein [Verrucomicrobiae bacterium]|nr:glycosyltransferase family 39 protein [Verrucomicrobiae bacterium]
MARPTGAPESSVQSAVFQIEMGRGKKVLQWAALFLLAAVLSPIYTASQFRNGLGKREAIDMAQLARNIARGEGFTTHVIRPLSLWQLEQNGWDIQNKDTRDGLINRHPDISNPPLYPFLLAQVFKILPKSVFKYNEADHIFPAERWGILPFNQLCLLASILIMYLWAKQLFDSRVAAMAGWLMLFSDTLWSYGISGLPTNLLMLLFLLAVYCLFLADGRLNPPEPAEGEGANAQPARVAGAVVALTVGSAVLLGLCFLTRYLAGFFLVPLAIYAARIFRGRAAAMWAGVYVVAFLAVITPWLVRNERVSGSLLGVAKYELIERSGTLQGEALQRSYQPDFTDAYSLRQMISKFLSNARPILLTNLRVVGSDFLVLFFGVGLMYGFRRRDATRLRGVLLGAIAAAIFGMALIGSEPERIGPEVGGGNLLVLLLPLIAIFGVAFFYLLLDRIPFRIKLTRGMAIGVFAALNVSPMIFTMLPPRAGSYPYPPYIPPVTRAVANLFEPNELGCSDLPWSMAWDGDRRTVWLPMTVDEFYQISDFVAPKGVQFMFLTPYFLDAKRESEVLRGEYKGWAGIYQGQLRADFPLKAFMAPTVDHILLADRTRWAKKPAEEAPAGLAQPSETGATNALAPSIDSTNQLAAPPAVGAKPAAK